VTLRLCLHCGRHYHAGTGVRGRCGDCGRAYDRELSRQKRARRARNSAAWQKARAAAKQRDGNRCVNCGATEHLQVHQSCGSRMVVQSSTSTTRHVVCRLSQRATPGGAGLDGQTGSHTGSMLFAEITGEYTRRGRGASNRMKTRPCPACGGEITDSGPGRPRRYCVECVPPGSGGAAWRKAWLAEHWDELETERKRAHAKWMAEWRAGLERHRETMARNRRRLTRAGFLSLS